MIYVKDGKLLVSADGKLCSTCCPVVFECNYELVTCDYFDCWESGSVPDHLIVEFSGVRRCCDDTLITELNAQHCLALYCPSTGFYSVILQDIDIDGTTYDFCIGVGDSPYGGENIQVMAITDGGSCPDDFQGGLFANNDADPPCPPNAYNNDLVIGTCGGIQFGYGGSVTLTDPSEQL